jgi:hypothetical protein
MDDQEDHSSRNGQWLTYRDPAERLGISVEAAQQKARRGRWTRREGNDGRRLVLVPYEAMGGPAVSGTTSPKMPGTIAPTIPDTTPAVPPAPVYPAVHGVTDHAEALIDELRRRAAAAEARERSALARFDQERQEVEHARLAAERLQGELETERQHARDMATRIDRLHQERHAEAERQRQEMDSLRGALEDARRPWLRRLAARWTGKR